MVVDGAGCYCVLSCLLLCVTLTRLVESIPHICIVERNSPMPVQRQLSLTHAGLRKNVFDGAVLMSTTKGLVYSSFGRLLAYLASE